MMSIVFLGVGSNIEPEKHITSALDALDHLYGPLIVSSVYESEAIGFVGENFLNLVVGIKTNSPVRVLIEELKQIENDHGRCRLGPKYSARTLDIDILTVDDCVGDLGGIVLPRDEITEHAFVLQPLAEIAPDQLHPVLKKSYAELWKDFDKSGQRLWPVSVSCRTF